MAVERYDLAVNGTILIVDDDDDTAVLLRDSLRKRGFDVDAVKSQTLQIDSLDFREPTGQLNLSIHDGNSGERFTARVSIKQQNGKFHFPVGALYRFTSGFGHFYARHSNELTLPAGKYTLRLLSRRGSGAAAVETELSLAEVEFRSVRLPESRLDGETFTPGAVPPGS